MLSAIDATIGLHTFLFLLVAWPMLVSLADLLAREGRFPWTAVAACATVGIAAGVLTFIAFFVRWPAETLPSAPPTWLALYPPLLVLISAVQAVAAFRRWRGARRRGGAVPDV